MKKEKSEVRNIFVKIRMNEQELEDVKKNQLKTTEQNLSNYIRKVAMQKPVIVKFRNQSVDDFLKDMLLLKKELSAVAIILTRQYTSFICWIRYRSFDRGYFGMMLCRNRWWQKWKK